MARRIEVELTSERPDGTWTWRAAGARQPRGVVPADLLHPGAKVGDVVRAEAEFDLEGITITSVLAPLKDRTEPERLEVIGPAREVPPVTSTWSGREERERRGPRTDRRPRDDRGPARGRKGDDRRPDRAERSDRPDRERRRDGADSRPPREARRERAPRQERPAPPPAPPPRPKPKRLRPARTHRDALLAALPSEQQPVAEQVLRGGLPGVRTALDEQNAALRADGKPEVPVDAILAIAEEVLPRARVADWLDRAEAAVADAEELSLRDLRSVVVSAEDVAREESTRELAGRLREVLDRRTNAEQEEWLADLKSSLEGGRVVRALRLSSRPPGAGATMPPDLTTQLTEAASAALAPDVAPERWSTVLDAVAYSPVRRNVQPAGAPAEPGDELMAAARKHVGRVPAIGPLFGIEAPAPPPPSGSRGRRPRREAPKEPPPRAANPRIDGRPPPPPGPRRIPPPPGAAVQARPPVAQPAPAPPPAPVAEPEPAAADAAEPEAAPVAEPEPAAAEPAPPAEPPAVASDAPPPPEPVPTGEPATAEPDPVAAAPWPSPLTEEPPPPDDPGPSAS